MRKFLAEQVPALVSGAIALFGAVLIVPQVAAVFSIGNLTLGDFGLFLLVAWGTGYAVEAVGLVLEQLFWSPFGGPPMTWPAGGRRQVLTRPQLDAVAARARARLGVDHAEIRALTEEQWVALYRRIYRSSAGGGDTKIASLVDAYRMSRAMAASFLLVSALVLLGDAFFARGWILATLALAVASVYRMYRSAVRLVEEALLRFAEAEEAGDAVPGGSGLRAEDVTERVV